MSGGGETADSTALRRTLGLPSLVLFGLVYMVPLTIFTTYGLVTETSGGRVAVAYMVTLAAMIFTAWSYASMSKVYQVAGSAYSYTRQAFGGEVGFVMGWALLLDYLLLPLVNYLIIGIYLNAEFPSVPDQVWIVLAIAALTLLNIIGIVSIARANVALMVAQGVFIVVFVVMGVAHLSDLGGVDPLTPLSGDGTAPGIDPVLAGAAILALSFLGFDAVSTLTEEARDPERAVPRAILMTTVVGGLLFIALSYLSQLVFPSNQFTDIDAGALDVMAAAGGDFLKSFFTAAYIAGCVGAALTSQASVARILYAMGRDGVLPRSVFGRLSARFNTPVLTILIVAAISLLALVADLGFVIGVVSFGALVAFSAVNLTVIKQYIIDGGLRDGRSILLYGVAPAVGFGLTVWLWTSLSGKTLIYGLIWIAVGVAYLAWLTRGFSRAVPLLAE